MKFTNQEIYDYAVGLTEAFSDSTQKLPIKINFYLQKNKKILRELSADIEMAREDIIRTYGVLNEETGFYQIPKENLEQAQKEVSELLALEQEVDICYIDLSVLDDDYVLSTGQMEALMFMIN